MADINISYDDYLRLRQQQDQSAFSESGTSNLPPAISEDDWNKLSTKDRLEEMGGYVVTPNDPMWHDLAGPTGAEDGRSIQLLAQPPAHFGDPNYWVDPSKVSEVSDGIYAFAQNNKTPRYQAEENQMETAGKIILGATGGVFLSGALAAAGVAGESGAAAAGADSTAAGGTDLASAIDASGGAYEPSIYATDATATAAGPQITADIAADSLPATAADGAAAASNYAPVVDGSTPITSDLAPVVDHSVNAGIVDTVRNGATSIGNWYRGLSPGARLIIGTAISQGGSAIQRGIATRDAQRYAEQVRDQQREDVTRRHQIPAFSDNAFKPRGIIDGARGG